MPLSVVPELEVPDALRDDDDKEESEQSESDDDDTNSEGTYIADAPDNSIELPNIEAPLDVETANQPLSASSSLSPPRPLARTLPPLIAVASTSAASRRGDGGRVVWTEPLHSSIPRL